MLVLQLIIPVLCCCSCFNLLQALKPVANVSRRSSSHFLFLQYFFNPAFSSFLPSFRPSFAPVNLSSLLSVLFSFQFLMRWCLYFVATRNKYCYTTFFPPSHSQVDCDVLSPSESKGWPIISLDMSIFMSRFSWRPELLVGAGKLLKNDHFQIIACPRKGPQSDKLTICVCSL